MERMTDQTDPSLLPPALTTLPLTVIGDARVVVDGRFFGAARMCHHLWPMCLGLSLAAGSGSVFAGRGSRAPHRFADIRVGPNAGVTGGPMSPVLAF